MRCTGPKYVLPPDYGFLPYKEGIVDCPTEYRAVLEQCYLLLGETFPEDAQEACTQANGTLAEVKDDATNGAIYNFTFVYGNRRETVIGVYCRDNCTTDLKTYDGSIQTFTAWEECEPYDKGSGTEQCVVTNFRHGKNKAQWNNVRCHNNSASAKEYQTICQMKGEGEIAKNILLVH